MAHVVFKNASLNEHGVPEITPQDLTQILKDPAAKVQLIDVRRPEEYTGELGHIANAKLSTLEQSLVQDLRGWSPEESYVFICRSGMRSSQATGYALSLGFKNVVNLQGGMLLWNDLKLPRE